MRKLEVQIKEQIVGQKILTVTYFEVNHFDRAFFHDNFDTFDLAINIEMSNGFQWHIGWSNKENHEVGIGPYLQPNFIDSFKKVDATFRWLEHGYAHVKEFELIYVNEAWKIPAKCTITFDNNDQITLVLANELNLDESLPIPLAFSDNVEIYVFYGQDLPEIELIQMELEPYFEENDDLVENGNDDVNRNEAKKSKDGVKTPNLVGVFILFIVVVIIVIRESLKQ